MTISPCGPWRFVVQVISAPFTVPSDFTSLPSRSFDVTVSFSPDCTSVMSYTRSPRGFLAVTFHLPLTSSAAAGRANATASAAHAQTNRVLRVTRSSFTGCGQYPTWEPASSVSDYIRYKRSPIIRSLRGGTMRSITRTHPHGAALAFAGALTLSLQALAAAQEAGAPAAPQPSVTLPPPLARVLRDYESAWQKKDA